MNARQKASRFAPKLLEALKAGLPHARVWLDPEPSFCDFPALKVTDGSSRVIRLTLQVPHDSAEFLSKEIAQRFAIA